MTFINCMRTRVKQLRMRRAGVLCLISMVAMVGLAGCGASNSLSGPVVAASVNGNGIGLYSYQKMLTFADRASAGTDTSWRSPAGRTTQASLQSGVLSFLIDLELAREQARACGVSVSQQDIAVQKRQLVSEANTVLKDPTNSEWPTFHALLSVPYALELYSEQQAYQVKLLKVLHLPTAQVSYILVSSRAQAESLLQQAKTGANFATLGQKTQSAPNSTASYSDVGTVYIGEFLPQFDNAVFAGAKTSRPGCYNSLKLTHSPQRYQMFALTGQSAGQYMVVETRSVANGSVASLGDAQTEGTIFSAWIDEIVRLPGNSTIDKYLLPATTATS